MNHVPKMDYPILILISQVHMQRLAVSPLRPPPTSCITSVGCHPHRPCPDWQNPQATPFTPAGLKSWALLT